MGTGSSAWRKPVQAASKVERLARLGREKVRGERRALVWQSDKLQNKLLNFLSPSNKAAKSALISVEPLFVSMHWGTEFCWGTSVFPLHGPDKSYMVNGKLMVWLTQCRIYSEKKDRLQQRRSTLLRCLQTGTVMRQHASKAPTQRCDFQTGSSVRLTESHPAWLWHLFCGTENNYSAAEECVSIHSQIMENISKLGLKSKRLTPNYCI